MKDILQFNKGYLPVAISYLIVPKFKNKSRISALITVIHQFTGSLVMMQNKEIKKKIEIKKELKLFLKTAMSVYVEKTIKSGKKNTKSTK